MQKFNQQKENATRVHVISTGLWNHIAAWAVDLMISLRVWWFPSGFDEILQEIIKSQVSIDTQLSINTKNLEGNFKENLKGNPKGKLKGKTKGNKKGNSKGN